MKQTKLWLTTIAVLLCSATAIAYDLEVDGIYYNIISSSDLTVEVTRGDKEYSGEIVIPSKITYKSKMLTVTSIEDYVFDNCTSLTSIIIGDSVTSVKRYAFRGCTGLISVTTGNGVTNIDNYAFMDCTSLTNITIGNSVGNIGLSAFENCSSLTNITIPNNVGSIQTNAFNGCTSLRDLCIEDGERVLNMGYSSHSDRYYNTYYYGLFQSCPLQKVYLGRSISSSDLYTPFRDKSILKSLTIGDNVDYIIDYMFYGCSSLTNVVIPDGAVRIGDQAFEDCSELASIVIGENVRGIGENAFKNCHNLTSITIPANVKSIGNGAFAGCTSLKDLCIEDGDTPLSLGYGRYLSYSTGDGLFYSCPLENIYLGRDLEYETGDKYGYSPFKGQKKLKTLTIGNGITNIEDNTFWGCAALTDIVISNSVTNIGDYVFEYCSELTSITIGHNVESIGDYAFEGCKKLTDVYLYASTPPVISRETFTESQYVNVTLFVPEGVSAFYQTADNWKEFWEIKELGTYKIDYIVDGGLFATDSIVSGSKIILLDEPIKDGRKFSGWSEAPNIMPTNDITVEGVFDYLLTYKVNGEIFAVDSIEYGDTIIPKDIVVKEGQTFSGWVDLPETMPANDITVYGTIDSIVPNEVVLNKQVIITTVNSVYQLYATVYPEDAIDKTVVWTSSDESIAKVSDSGYVTGISVGKATITASCGSVFASCEVEVEVENFIKTQPTAENLLVELNTPEEGVEYQWYQYVEGMIYSKEIVPTSTGDYAWTESNGVWTSGNNKEGPQTFSVMTATVRVQLGDAISFDYTVPKGDGRYDGGSQWLEFTINGETYMQTFGGVNGGAGHYELDINDYIIDRYLNEDSTMTIGFECVRKNTERATVSNIKHTRPTGFYKGMVDEKIIGATAARLDDSLFVEGSVVYCVVTLPNGRTLTSDKVNMYKVYYYVGEELVHTAEVAYGEAIPEYVYEPTAEGDVFMGWIGETYETMPAHDVTYTANIESGINQLLLDNGQLIIYDLMGRKVLNMENLKGGIYIVNGKKVVVK